MKHGLAMVLAAGILLGVAGCAVNQANGPASKPASASSIMPAPVMGVLTKVEGNKLILKSMRAESMGKRVIVTTDGQTEYSVDFERGSLADLKLGMMISLSPYRVTYRSPVRVVVVATTAGLLGKVIQVEGNSVRLRVRPESDPSGEMTVVIDDKTKVIFLGMGPLSGQPGKLADLEPDMTVQVLPASGTPTKIVAITPRRAHPASLPAAKPSRP